MTPNTNHEKRTATVECTCGGLDELHITRTLIHGGIARCGTCGGIYSTTETDGYFTKFLVELALPPRDTLKLVLDAEQPIPGEVE